MIHIVVVNEVKEGYLEVVKEQLALLVAETVKEEGCIRYNAFFSTNNENTISFVETWETQAHLDAHLETEHIKSYRAKTADMFVSRSVNFLELIA